APGINRMVSIDWMPLPTSLPRRSIDKLREQLLKRVELVCRERPEQFLGGADGEALGIGKRDDSFVCQLEISNSSVIAGTSFGDVTEGIQVVDSASHAGLVASGLGYEVTLGRNT